jgi:UDP-glucuronate 4-epimerase
MNFIRTIEVAWGKETETCFLPMQNGDVLATYADIDALRQAIGFEPTASLKDGISRWVEWFYGYARGA